MRPGDYLPQALSRSKRVLDIPRILNDIFRFTPDVRVTGRPLISQRKGDLSPLPRQGFMVS